jgi:hypothetical protein
MSTGVGVCATANSTQNQKLRKRRPLALTSTFSRIAGSGSIRAISIAPTVVEKMEKKARSLLGMATIRYKRGHLSSLRATEYLSEQRTVKTV